MSGPQRVGMVLDTSLCIGCRACQVACREWNGTVPPPTEQTGSYQNPPGLSGDTWKQVKFLESTDDRGAPRWLFYSDSCKHCFDAPCMRACPTGAISRTSEGVIRVDPDVCNGNGHCVPACPYGVIGIGGPTEVAQKCTMCEDRIGEGSEPACAAVCPTDCITFGTRDVLLERAKARLGELKAEGHVSANLYGAEELGGLGVMMIFLEHPSYYGVPEAPVAPRDRVLPASLWAVAWGALALALAAWGLGVAA